MPDHEAARVTDPHLCPSIEPGPVPHVGGPIQSGSDDVLIEDLKAARGAVDYARCAAGGPDFIAQGSGTVLINDKVAARKLCKTQHNGVILGLSPTVLIGGPTVTVLAISQRTGGVAAAPKKPPGKDTGPSKPAESSRPSGGEKGDQKPTEPNQPCSMVDFVVSCSHDPTGKRRASNGTLQVVGEGTLAQTNASVNPPGENGYASWISLQASSEVTEGGAERITVAIVRNDSTCGAKHAVAMTTSPSAEGVAQWVEGDRHEFPLRWDGPEPEWPTSQPMVRYVHARGCDEGAVRTCRIEMFQPTQVKLTLGVGESWDREADTESSLKKDFFKQALNDFRVETDISGSGSLSFGYGYKEAVDDPRILFECRGSGTLELTFRIRGYANLITIAALFVAAPLAMVTRFLKYGIVVEFFIGAAITLSRSLELAVARYVDGGYGGGMTPSSASATLSIETGLRMQAGFEWVQAIGVEGGAKVDFPGTHSLEINDRGIYNSLLFNRSPIMLFVTVVAKGWFVNAEHTYQVEVFPGSEREFGYKNKALYLFR